MSEQDTDAKKKDDPFAEALQAAADAVDRVRGKNPEDEDPAEEAAPAAAAPAPVESAPAPVESAPADAEALEAARKETAGWKDRALREAAALVNFRKRATKEKEELRKFAVESLLKDLLPVADNIERALAHAADDDPLAAGVGMVSKQLLGVLEQHGCKPFDAQGRQFDPAIHEAMTQVERDDVEPGTVVEVFQRGWYLADRLARPAMVIVASAPAGAPRDTQPVADVDEDEKEASDADEEG